MKDVLPVISQTQEYSIASEVLNIRRDTLYEERPVRFEIFAILLVHLHPGEMWEAHVV
jgi:hypothetical protein